MSRFSYLIAKIQSNRVRTRPAVLGVIAGFKQGVLAIQAVNPLAVLNRRHLLGAIWHAFQSYESHRMITRSLSLEVALFLAGTRQISKALEFCGLSDVLTEAGLIVIYSSDDVDTSGLERDFKRYFESHEYTVDEFVPFYDIEIAEGITKELDLGHYLDLGEQRVLFVLLSRMALLSLVG